jgi:hypothetical protein
VPLSKAILLILVLVTAAVAVGVSACGMAGIGLHTQDVALPAVIGIVAGIAGLVPLHLRIDRTPAGQLQSAWMGSILHMATAALLGIGCIYLLKRSTPFVVWLLAMYWISLIGLCIALARTLRSMGNGQGQVENLRLNA